MKRLSLFQSILSFVGLLFVGLNVRAQNDQINIIGTSRGPGNEKPIYVSLSGISGEAAQVLKF